MQLSGVARHDGSEWRLFRSGTNDSVGLGPLTASIGTDDLHANLSMTWEGRWRQMESADGLSIVYTLDNADVQDTDGDRLADELETAIGTSPTAEDSDDDGVDDRTEHEASMN